jgi:hypothetical protein
MNLLTLWLISDNERVDDKIEFERGSDPEEMLNVRYIAGELRKTKHAFTLSRQGVHRYITNILYSLRMDQDPWDKIQVSPATGPSIIYHVSDLKGGCEGAILDIVDQILYISVQRICE